MMTVDDRHVIAIGEPGCYAHYGHIDGDAVLRVVLDLWDEDTETLEPARHTWLTVTDCDEQHISYDPNSEAWYVEVMPGTPHAHPFTLIPVVDSWNGPKENTP